jgi:hypothetical protein
MNPSAEQLDHLIGHTDHRALTAEEHAALRAGIQQLRASLAGTGAALRRAPSGAYVTQLRQQAARADRYRGAWQSARRRAADNRSSCDTLQAAAECWANDLARLGHDQMKRAEQAEARVAELTANLAPTEDALTRVLHALADVRATRGLLGRVIADQIEAALNGATQAPAAVSSPAVVVLPVQPVQPGPIFVQPCGTEPEHLEAEQ